MPVVSAPPQPGVAFTQLQGGEGPHAGVLSPPALGGSLQLDTMHLSQAWRCALTNSDWTVPSCVRCAHCPPLLTARAPAAVPPTAHTRERETNAEIKVWAVAGGAGGLGEGWVMSYEPH